MEQRIAELEEEYAEKMADWEEGFVEGMEKIKIW